jgi:hypothetical protein
MTDKYADLIIQYKEKTKQLVKDEFSTEEGMDKLAERMIVLTAINEDLEKEILQLKAEIRSLIK